MKMSNLKKFKDFQNGELNEKKIVHKRKYTEKFPSKHSYSNSKIKAKILEAIGDKKITKEEFNKIIQELDANKRWSSRNMHLFKMNEEGITLSKVGKIMYEKSKLIESIMLNPGMNVIGMGPVKFPGNAGTTTAFHGQNIGSGDVPMFIADPSDKKDDTEEVKRKLKKKKKKGNEEL
jgi:hypothetical protein